jgi:Tol biopolymer transport system component
MQPQCSRQAGSLLVVFLMVLTMLGVPYSPVHADVPASDNFALNSLSTVIKTITRVSVASSGVQGNNNSYGSAISSNGRYVVFYSYADNLVSEDTNGAPDVFLRDTMTAITTRLSVDPSGAPGNSWSIDQDSPSISSDGRYVVFRSMATNLVSGGTNGTYHIFRRDTILGTTTLISVSSGGEEANGQSYSPSISADGRYVAFSSEASNLVSGDTTGRQDIFLRDTQNNATTRISVATNGTPGNAQSYYPSVSADGHYVAFDSIANNLVSGDTNNHWDVFLHDTLSGTTTLVSVNSSWVQGNFQSGSPSISADGRYVAFDSYASNFVSGDANGMSDVFLRDTQANTTTRISVTSNGVEANESSDAASISADGRYVAFRSRATNLVSGDTNGTMDVFLRDTQTGTTSRLSVNSSGVEGNIGSNDPSISGSTSPSISADGSYVTFYSNAINLVGGDTNGFWDIFVTPAINLFTHRNYLPLVIR